MNLTCLGLEKYEESYFKKTVLYPETKICISTRSYMNAHREEIQNICNTHHGLIIYCMNKGAALRDITELKIRDECRTFVEVMETDVVGKMKEINNYVYEMSHPIAVATCD